MCMVNPQQQQQQQPPVRLFHNSSNNMGRIQPKSMRLWWYKKKNTVCHIVIVILLICITIHINSIIYHQQISTLMTTIYYNSENNDFDDDDSNSKLETNRNDISWEWKRYGSSSSSSSSSSSDSLWTTPITTTANLQYTPQILIAQYDAGGDNDHSNNNNNNDNSSSYALLLNITSRINQLYAYQYQLDYVLLRGIVFRTFYEPISQIPKSRATYNKIYILQKAMEWKYDYLLLLDSDAMIYDFNRDITQLLLPPHKMILAHQVVDRNHNQNEYYNINIGVTLWNVRHTMIRTIVRRWKILCYYRIIFRLDDNDQISLQNLLRYFITFGRSLSSTNEYLRHYVIEENHIDFAYRGGTFVKHFIRYNSQTWIQDDPHRIAEITKVANDICIRHEPICNGSSLR